MKTKETKVIASANSKVKSNAKDNNGRSRNVAPRTSTTNRILRKEQKLQKQLDALKAKRERQEEGGLSPKRAAYAEFKRVWRLAQRVKRLIGAFKNQDRVTATAAKKLTKELTAVQKNHNSAEGFANVKHVLSEMAHV